MTAEEWETEYQEQLQDELSTGWRDFIRYDDCCAAVLEIDYTTQS
jgi:hypothetical protein|tara:strand:- start:13128 stop:13262 length:135 start_codon:yes stop_codon:yes gene_type:complete